VRPPHWHPPIELSPLEKKVVSRIRGAKLFIFLRQVRHELFDAQFQMELATLFKDSSMGLCPVSPALQDSSSLESEKDFLESRKDITSPLTAELSQPLEETASVLSERKTPSSELLDESRPFAQEEPTQKGSDATNELLNSSLTHTQMVERLGVKSSTLGEAKKKPNFSSWSKSKDPDAIAWQWVVESKCFVPLKNQGG